MESRGTVDAHRLRSSEGCAITRYDPKNAFQTTTRRRDKEQMTVSCGDTRRDRRACSHLTSVPETPFEDTCVVVPWHVPEATHNVVDVLAERGRFGAVLARAEAEFAIRDEVLYKMSVSSLHHMRGKK